MNLVKSILPRWKEWGLLIVLFLAFRLGGLLLFHPVYSDQCPLEEYYRGAMANEILKGVSIPYWQYRADNFGGGSLVIAVIIAAFFKLFGDSVFVLRSVAVFISLAALMLWFKILYDQVSRKCAWYFALFFIFAPSSFQSLSMVPLGDHYETIFISALAVTMMLRIFQGRSFPGESFLLGLLCGFGVWFAYIFALTVAAILFFWFFKNRRLVLTFDFWQCALGFVLGFSPWVYTNYITRYGGLYIRDQPILAHLSLPFFEMPIWDYLWRNNFIRDIFDSFSHTDIGFPTAGFLVNWIYLFLILAPGFIWLFLHFEKGESLKTFLPKPQSDIAIYFVFYFVCYAIALQFTSFEGRRYVAPLMPAIFFAWARMMEALETFSPSIKQASRRFLAAPVLGLSIFLWILMVSPAYAGLLLKTQGYAYDYTASIPACLSYKGKDPCLDIAQNIPLEEQKNLWRGHAMTRAQEVASPTGGLLLEDVQFYTPHYAASFYYHYGKQVFYFYNSNVRKTFDFLRSTLDEKSTAFDLSLLGMFHAYGFEDMDVMQLLVRETPEKFSYGYFRAIGRQAAGYWWGPRTKINEIVENRWDTRMNIQKIYKKIKDHFPEDITVRERAEFFKGLGGFFVRNTYRQPIRGNVDFIKAKNLFNLEDRQAFFQGVGRADKISSEFSIASCRTWSHEYFTMEKDSEIQQWIREGQDEIQDLLNKFYSQYAVNPRTGQKGTIL